MRDRVFRTTRTLLRHYKAEGILDPDATIPHRDVRDRFIPMTAGEAAPVRPDRDLHLALLQRLHVRPGGQKPLGFIMTVYRRRLTSSFLAIERSLRRRLDVLVGQRAGPATCSTPTTWRRSSTSPFADLELDRPASRDSPRRSASSSDFLDELAKRPPDESKMSYLHDELGDAFHGPHDTVIVFTQYTDTMDYLREQLLPVYGAKLVCYSGRGGERWDPRPTKWVG